MCHPLARRDLPVAVTAASPGEVAHTPDGYQRNNFVSFTTTDRFSSVG